MNSFSSLIVNTRNNNKRASLALLAQSYSFNSSLCFITDNFVKFRLPNNCSMFDEHKNCVNGQYNQKKDEHQYRHSFAITTASTKHRPVFPSNNRYPFGKRYQHRGYVSNLPPSNPRPMISVDPKNRTIELMQQQEKTPLSCSSVNYPQSACSQDFNSNICDDHHMYKNKPVSSSQIRIGLRSTCLLDDNQQYLFDEIFTNNESPTTITERILDESISRLTKTYCNSLIILSGHYKEVCQLQVSVVSSALKYIYNFVNQEKKTELSLRLNVKEILNNKTISLISSNNYLITSPNETCQYLSNLCSEHRFNPLVITFHLVQRSSTDNIALFNILLTNDKETSKQQISDILISLGLLISSTRQKQSKKKNSTIEQLFSSILRDYVSSNFMQNGKYFMYIFANIKHDKQLKAWTRIQRLFRGKNNRRKMSRDRFDSYCDSSSVETVINRNNEEIWIDGPLCSSNGKQEIWIDGPPEFCSHISRRYPKRSTPKHRSSSSRYSSSKSKTPILSPTHQLPRFQSPIRFRKNNDENSSTNIDNESVISSHCHLPVLPVFKDHTLLPFRSNQALPKIKVAVNDSPKLDLRLSTNKLNDDMEMLEKTLETLLIPSPIVPKDSNVSHSLNRIDQLSSSMTTDEKTKRLSRIVSPTRFDKLLINNQLSDKTNMFHNPSPSPIIGLSVPNSPLIKPKTRRTPTPITSTPTINRRSVSSTKKSKNFVESNRPSILQRLFGLRSSLNPLQQQIPIIIEPPSSSTLISPLTVTLDSHDDLMPLTTCSTASSASGRASSSGYESMSNTALDEMIASISTVLKDENNTIKSRNKSIRKDERRLNSNTSWNDTISRDKSYNQQRILQLKHRQNELKLELAMTKTFLSTDKSKNFEHNESVNSTINNSPMHTLPPNPDEESELEKEIEHLEKRLASAKSQLLFVTYQKTKQLKS